MPGRCRHSIAGHPTWHGPNVGGNRPILCLLIHPPPVSSRQFPPSSISFRYGSPLAIASVGEISVWMGDDVGGAFLETQQPTGRNSGGSRPILRLPSPFFFLRQHPPPSAIFRSGSLLALAPDGDMSVCLGDDVGGASSGNRHRAGVDSGKSADSRSSYYISPPRPASVEGLAGFSVNLFAVRQGKAVSP